MQNEKMAAVAATIDKSISKAAQAESRISQLHGEIVGQISGQLMSKSVSPHIAIGFAGMVADDALAMRDAVEAKGHDFEASLRDGIPSLVASAVSQALRTRDGVEAKKRAEAERKAGISRSMQSDAVRTKHAALELSQHTKSGERNG